MDKLFCRAMTSPFNTGNPFTANIPDYSQLPVQRLAERGNFKKRLFLC